MILHCPCCHSRFSIDALAQDESARELLALRPSPVTLAYLGLFRTEARALPFDKALRLVKEIRDLGAPDQLEAAMADTVDALRGRGGKPLKNHNYLKRVLESQAPATWETVPGTPIDSADLLLTVPGRASKGSQAIAALMGWGQGDWLRTAIANGLAACVARVLPRQPAADVIILTADTWHQALAGRLTIRDLDAPRITRGFELLLPTLTEWPQPKQLQDIMPKRPDRTKIRHEPTEADRQAGKDALRGIHQTLNTKVNADERG